jgi:lysophospholipase L1-like esterase
VGIPILREDRRDRDESTAKPGNTLRIAFVGDSVTLGLGVDFKETFVRRFEAEANRRGFQHRIQALNFAVDGYATPQICEMVRTKVLDFEPDKVVYMMCMNDFDFTQSSGEKTRYFRKPRCFLLSRVRTLCQRWWGGEFHLYHFRRNKKTVFQSILGLRKMLEQEGSSLQVVILPVFFPGTTDFENYPLRAMHREIREYLERNGIRCCDLLEVFAAPEETPKYYASDVWHLNSEGHRFIARQLLSSILSD